MTVLRDKEQINRLSLLFALTYMVGYITRINYGAVIAEMVTDTGFSRGALALALTGSFVTYGLGQIVSGLFGDRVSPKRLVACGLAASAAMNLLIPFCTDPSQMLVVWSLNGFAQAFLWPPMVRLMTARLTREDYDRVVVRVSWGSSAGTVLVYLLAPLVISLSDWRGVFLISAVCGGAMILVWMRLCADEPVQKAECRPEKQAVRSGLLSPLMLSVMVTIVLQGMLRDGVATWMPSYIAETYSLRNETAILTGVILPLFGVASVNAASFVYRRRFSDPMSCAGVIFGTGAVSALALWFCSGGSPVLSVLFSALLTGSMHGVNLIQTAMIPSFFRKHGNVATVSGILNACTYVGSAVSTYGIALLSETAGWSRTVLLWAAVAAAGMAVSMACVRPWRKRFV